ncbi:MAG: arginine--tRNA ligase, partial [Planctomycetaceae bacterium]|nr:arginine--tRNA ligase [Planctomycetaceae bacterium]
MNFLSELRTRLKQALAGLVADPGLYVEMLRPTQDAKFGDFQANCAMPLGKIAQRPPRDVAAEIVSRLNVSDLCEAPDVAGPGFINLKLRTDVLARATTELVADE